MLVFIRRRRSYDWRGNQRKILIRGDQDRRQSREPTFQQLRQETDKTQVKLGRVNTDTTRHILLCSQVCWRENTRSILSLAGTLHKRTEVRVAVVLWMYCVLSIAFVSFANIWLINSQQTSRRREPSRKLQRWYRPREARELKQQPEWIRTSTTPLNGRVCRGLVVLSTL